MLVAAAVPLAPAMRRAERPTERGRSEKGIASVSSEGDSERSARVARSKGTTADAPSKGPAADTSSDAVGKPSTAECNTGSAPRVDTCANTPGSAVVVAIARATCSPCPRDRAAAASLARCASGGVLDVARTVAGTGDSVAPPESSAEAPTPDSAIVPAARAGGRLVEPAWRALLITATGRLEECNTVASDGAPASAPIASDASMPAVASDDGVPKGMPAGDPATASAGAVRATRMSSVALGMMLRCSGIEDGSMAPCAGRPWTPSAAKGWVCST